MSTSSKNLANNKKGNVLLSLPDCKTNLRFFAKSNLHAVYTYLKNDIQILDINIHDHVAYNLKLHKIKLRRGSVLAVLGHNAA